MVYYSGKFLGIGVEAEYGGGAAVTTMVPADKVTFSDQLPILPVNTVVLALTPTDASLNNLGYSGSFSAPLRSQGVGSLLMSALGSSYNVSNLGGGLGAYAFEAEGVSGPSFQLTTSTDVMTLNRYGARVNSLAISAAFNELVSSQWDIVGTNVQRFDVDPTIVYPAYPTADPLTFTGIQILRDGAQIDHVKSFSLQINSNLTPLNILRKNSLPALYRRGEFSIGFSCVIDLASGDEWDLLYGGTEFFLTLSFTGPGGEAMLISVPRMRWANSGIDLSATGSNEYSLDASVLSTVGGSPIAIDLTTSLF